MYKLHMKKAKTSPEPGNACGIPYRKTKGFPCPPRAPVEGVEARNQHDITIESGWLEDDFGLPFGALGAYFQGRTVSFRDGIYRIYVYTLEVLCHHVLQVDSQQKQHDFFRRVKNRHPKRSLWNTSFWMVVLRWDFQDAPFEGVPYFPAAKDLEEPFLRWCLKRHILWKLSKKTHRISCFQMDGKYISGFPDVGTKNKARVKNASLRCFIYQQLAIYQFLYKMQPFEIQSLKKHGFKPSWRSCLLNKRPFSCASSTWVCLRCLEKEQKTFSQMVVQNGDKL